MHIPFNKPYITGKEVDYIYDAVATGKISGNGKYTRMCQQYFEERWGFKKTLLTTSCTDALEMCAILLNIAPGDEVIMPSYTFVSTALAFVRQGAKIVFADSRPDHPGVDEDALELLITPRTKAIVAVHYAGVACNMQRIMEIANKHNLFVVEDAAHATDSYYLPPLSPLSLRRGAGGEVLLKAPLGSIGHLATFSFHETKNIQCGEGGMIAINDDPFIERAEIIWEKGTNRAAFFRGEIDKYGWVDTGSSFLPSEVTAAFLWAQIEAIYEIQEKRCVIWQRYLNGLGSWAAKNRIQLPQIPEYASNNAHMFYLVCPDAGFRNTFISHLKNNNIGAVFHYQSLHNSQYYKAKHDRRILPESDRYSDCLVRLPLFYEISDEQQQHIIETCQSFIHEQHS